MTEERAWKDMTSIEKHHFKITVAVAVTVILFIIYTTYTMAMWQAKVQNDIANIDARQTHLADKYVDTNARITELERKSATNDVQFATINTKLANIETMLLEIKVQLKEHDSNK